MNNNEFIKINDTEFEDLLKSSVPYKPPEEIVKAVTPWKKAIKRVLWGLALNTLTLNLFYLNYILPVIGTILSILGIRVLRNETKWFKAYYTLNIIRVVYLLFVLCFNATINLREMIPQAVSVVVNLLLTFLNIVFFCASLYSVEKKSGIQPRTVPMFALVLWYAGVAFLGIINFNGFIIPWVMIIGFIVILVSLNKISKDIDQIGYSIENSPVKTNDGLMTALIVIAVVASIGCGYAFGGSYKMQWEVKDKNEHIEVTQVRTHLLLLGFPEDVLNDMTAEDILKCKDATKVVVYEDKAAFNDNFRMETVTVQKTPYFKTKKQVKVYDVEEMTVTGIGVCLSEETQGDGNWQLIHHFCWDVNPGFYGTESMQLWPGYRQRSGGYRSNGEISGRVLYTKDGIDYVSPYHRLGAETYTSDSIFWGQETNTDSFATFSLPNNGERQRGYITYGIADNKDDVSSVIDSWVNYTHQESFLQYPAITAKEKRQTDGANKSFPFRTHQSALQIADRELMQ